MHRLFLVPPESKHNEWRKLNYTINDRSSLLTNFARFILADLMERAGAAVESGNKCAAPSDDWRDRLFIDPKDNSICK